jgi:methylglyoxal synthase
MPDAALGNNALSATVWLLAHDSQIPHLATLIQAHADILKRYRLAAPANIAQRLRPSAHIDIHPVEIDRLETEAASGHVLAVIFLIDPTLQPRQSLTWLNYLACAASITSPLPSTWPPPIR